MDIIVQKFGGTSVKNEEVRKKAAAHVKAAVHDGYKVVVVVSAIGRKGDPYATDTLLSLLNEFAQVNKREQDLLVSCGEVISAVVFSGLLRQMGLMSMAMTGPQAGFRTNDDFTNAKIVEMNCDHLKQTLKQHDVVVVSGFQGQSPVGDVTTLGRGGSDTSATALAAAISAKWVDIFTDVEGVMTADPRIVAEARPLTSVTYDEISNMAHQGAKVIHPRAVEIAMQANIPIHIRSTYADAIGTVVTDRQSLPTYEHVQERLITGIANISNITQIKVLDKEGQFNLQEKVFKAMANAKISVDFININPLGVVYTVSDEDTTEAINILTEMGYEPTVTKNCAKVSAIGAGMTGVPGVTAKIVAALSKENIEILQSADSHTTIWVLVKEQDMEKAVNALHRMFHLQKDGTVAESIDD
ncbi:aspartate kinase [Desertibacillus haloalkaliphilus]|uniref:aspartate kinase n=1 Tax=Desertibacillus haloalkaliphilus TaxID=1328930 RepID=UPI001C26EEF6|nr:aspartate kinase [Desertibacillus haloalkaliphilus]MBU8906958.1 aspartate kinase [Desertibacillus haloalkaliphilus]